MGIMIGEELGKFMDVDVWEDGMVVGKYLGIKVFITIKGLCCVASLLS
jgi:hypothetical protein